MLVREAIQRTQSEFLQAGNIRLPAWDLQVGALTDSSTALTVGGRTNVSVPSDGIIEWDDDTMELASVYSVTGTAVTLQERGYLETTAAAHTAGTRVLLDPVFPKKIVFNALTSLIGMLYSYGVYRRVNSTALTYSVTAPVALPTGARDTAGDIWTLVGTTYQKLRKNVDYEVIHAFTPPRIQFGTGGIPGTAILLDYKAEFTLPTTITDDLTTLGISTSLQEGLPMGVAALLLSGRDVPAAQAAHIRRTLEQQSTPLGSATSIGNSLWETFTRRYLEAERVRLLEKNPTSIGGYS